MFVVFDVDVDVDVFMLISIPESNKSYPLRYL